MRMFRKLNTSTFGPKQYMLTDGSLTLKNFVNRIRKGIKDTTMEPKIVLNYEEAQHLLPRQLVNEKHRGLCIYHNYKVLSLLCPR